jgi:hypothetical protein
MDVFNYLDEDNKKIAETLRQIVQNYSGWAFERVFEEAKKVFESIKNHFAKDTLLENNMKNPKQLENLLSEVAQKRKDITADIEQIVEIHVDEPGFEQSLETIANKYDQYHQYCKDKLYPKMKESLSPDEKKHIEEQLEQKIFS